VFKKQNGIIHFTNRSHGKLSWFDYGRRIAELGGFNVELVKPIESLERIAKRPKNSTLNIEKILSLVNIEYWDEVLTKTI
jgi:dTDP-4-dehydrorhamnose reductase